MLQTALPLRPYDQGDPFVWVFGVSGEKRYNREIMASPSGRITMQVNGGSEARQLSSVKEKGLSFEKPFLGRKGMLDHRTSRGQSTRISHYKLGLVEPAKTNSKGPKAVYCSLDMVYPESI